MQKLIKKAVFPVAGLGTRFLPATKANPKEMLPIVDKPLIQYAVEEAVQAGIEQLVFVTSSSKRAIEDHFDKNYELEAELIRKGKDDMLQLLRDIVPKNVSCVYVRQAEALGLGHAVLCAEPVVGNEPFAILLADDLIDGNGQSSLAQMVDVYSSKGCSLVGVERIPLEDTNKYGIVDVVDEADKVSKINSIVEKPDPSVAPSTLGVVGRYILSGDIFDLLRNTGTGAGGEIQLTDAIATLMKKQTVNAYQFDGVRYDCGSKVGYLDATMNYASKHPELKQDFNHLINKYWQIINK
ncbi:UTP--glucose-1-phosphate uridylyltransferase [hydrothermal vent metagenome]|uniref:UTP--glucose-1-phosphate uridylyltransferase n=1 Tax=hydrothermal vent metagenome TaxID=652676 RepID=A0A3B0Z4T6_9ZZZZ